MCLGCQEDSVRGEGGRMNQDTRRGDSGAQERIGGGGSVEV